MMICGVRPFLPRSRARRNTSKPANGLGVVSYEVEVVLTLADAIDPGDGIRLEVDLVRARRGFA